LVRKVKSSSEEEEIGLLFVADGRKFIRKKKRNKEEIAKKEDFTRFKQN
jgi:hypothetical protein